MIVRTTAKQASCKEEDGYQQLLHCCLYYLNYGLTQIVQSNLGYGVADGVSV